MFHKMVVRRVFIPITSSAMLSATVLASSEKEEKKELIRPRDLSIYSKSSKSEDQFKKIEDESKVVSTLTLAVRQVREGIWAVSDQLGEVADQVNHVFETGKAHTSTALQTLREEDNYVQRYGAIAMGGAIGYAWGLRRGKLRRLFNSAVGSIAVAAICYPEQAKEISSEGLKHVKRYIVIAYHFANGVLRDYAGVQLPNLPGPLSIGTTTAAEKDASTVPTSAALMPPPASTPSHIPASGPIPLPPIDLPSSVTDSMDAKKKRGTDVNDHTEIITKIQDGNEETNPQPQNSSFVVPAPSYPVDNLVSNDDYNLYSRRN